MKTRYAVALVVPLLAAGALGALVLTTSPSSLWPENDDAQRLKFSHKYHVSEVGVACADCHTAARTSASSTDNLRPGHDQCATCHKEQIDSTCGFCHVNPEQIEPAPPRKYTITFSHAQHVTMKDVECTTCHAGLDSVEYASAANMPAMNTCTTCHNASKATNTCEACHTSFTNLIPPDHLVADFRRDHKQRTRLGSLEASCSTCHTQTFCADCHDAASLMKFGKDGLMSEPSPRSSSFDSPKQMPLQMVHSMNYRYTHGIDAKAKASDCYSCHSEKEFCTPCHQSGDNLTEKSFKPASHLVPNFTTLGVGSGGGEHAVLARRDIESCASCHDVQGGDPTCITCHTDADGIRGTDPRTHPPGFMRNDEGPWHTDPGATCYNCHTDMNAHPGGVKGKNFCGYCHG